MNQEDRIKLYKETLEELKKEHEVVVKELEQMKVREFLLRKTIDYLDQLTRPPGEVTFHLVSKGEFAKLRK